MILGYCYMAHMKYTGCSTVSDYASKIFGTKEHAKAAAEDEMTRCISEVYGDDPVPDDREPKWNDDRLVFSDGDHDFSLVIMRMEG